MTKNLIVLLLICTIAFVLRIYRLDLLPLYTDEAGHYYYYWWTQTHQIWQNPILWLNTHIFSFTWFLGLNSYAARLPAVIASSLLPLVTYWWIKQLPSKDTNSSRIALTTALLTAILPWNYMIGRIGHTHIPIVLMLIMAFTGFYLRNQYKLSLLMLILGVYWYPSMLIIFPFGILLIFAKLYSNKQLTFIKTNLKKILLLGSLSLAVITIIFVYRYHGLTTSSRAFELAIWRDANVTAQTNEQRGLARNSNNSLFSLEMPSEKIVNKLFLNKQTAILNVFGQNYATFFTPQWLFFSGDPILRHSTGTNGMFFWWLAPFMILGAFKFFSKSGTWEKWLIGSIILISPIPAAITSDGAGYLLRAITMLPFLTFFAAIGIVSFIGNSKNKTIRMSYWAIIGILIFFSSWNFYFKYFHVYPAMAASSFEDGWRELALWQNQHTDQPLLVINQGYYADETFRFYQQPPLNQYTQSAVNITELGQTKFYQTAPNLYFAWPHNPQDLATFIQSHPNLYIAYPKDYLNLYPKYQPLAPINKTIISGKFINSVWQINQTNPKNN